MKKLFVFYVVASVALFGAVFAGFALIGIATAPAPDAPVPAEETVAEISNLLDVPPPPPLRYPDLPRGGMYQVSYATLLSSEASRTATQKEYLPEHGIFLIEERLTVEDELWYEVTVSDGQSDYLMFLRAADLNYVDISPYGPQPRGADIKYEALIASMEADLEEHKLRAEARHAWEAEAQRSDLDRMSERVDAHVSTFSSSDWLRISVQASAVSLVILAFTTVGAWLVARKRWDNTALQERREADAEALEDEDAEGEDALYPDSSYQQQEQQQQPQHARRRVGTSDFDK